MREEHPRSRLIFAGDSLKHRLYRLSRSNHPRLFGVALELPAAADVALILLPPLVIRGVGRLPLRPKQALQLVVPLRMCRAILAPRAVAKTVGRPLRLVTGPGPKP